MLDVSEGCYSVKSKVVYGYQEVNSLSLFVTHWSCLCQLILIGCDSSFPCDVIVRR